MKQVRNYLRANCLVRSLTGLGNRHSSEIEPISSYRPSHVIVDQMHIISRLQRRQGTMYEGWMNCGASAVSLTASVCNLADRGTYMQFVHRRLPFDTGVLLSAITHCAFHIHYILLHTGMACLAYFVNDKSSYVFGIHLSARRE
jgi:hypothetical protein